MNRSAVILPFVSFVLCLTTSAQQPAAKPKLDTTRGDKMLAEYFASETKKLQDNCLTEIKTLDNWKAKRGESRRQLLEMLGLDPLPEKTDLKPVITGRLEHDDFIVEKLHFQSRPGLYVTGNLYLPKKIEKPLPAILYVSGHSRVLVNDVPMGAKALYQHHGAWYARNGYACLTIDTLQLGEIEGIHHGTHRYGMWWWLNRGYTPAGVEAWNCVRALDYLETRPEIDKTRFGVTGRSGGGAYSWWIAAIDDRIKVAVPTAGITDLQNHVVDGTVEGHCDCMFIVNTYRWDYPQVAALLAPRPLLISNTDSDGIFPLDGVYRTFEKVRRIYRLFDAEKKGTSSDIALNISPGPHKDTQELNTHEFRWFNHYLKNDDSPIDSRAPKYFQPEQLKVFDKLPADQINTQIHETFVAKATKAEVPDWYVPWISSKEKWREAIEKKSIPFADWEVRRNWYGNIPSSESRFEPYKPAFVAVRDNIRLTAYDFVSQQFVRLRLYLLQRDSDQKVEANVLRVLDDQSWHEFHDSILVPFEAHLKGEPLTPTVEQKWVRAKSRIRDDEKNKLDDPFSSVVFSFICPRGVGLTAFDQSEKKQVQNRRRFYLLGQTFDEMQVWDVLSTIEKIKEIETTWNVPLWLRSDRQMAGVALYAALLDHNDDPAVKRLELHDLPTSHRDGPIFLNVERFLDMPQAVALAAENSKVVLYQDDDTGWEYPQAVAKALNWPSDQIQIRRKPK